MMASAIAPHSRNISSKLVPVRDLAGDLFRRFLFCASLQRILVLLALLLINADLSYAEPALSKEQPCSFKDPGLSVICDPSSIANSLMPPHRWALASAVVEALRNGKGLDVAYLNLGDFSKQTPLLPNLVATTTLIINSRPELATLRTEVERVLLKPRMLTDCLNENAPARCEMSINDVRKISIAMAAIQKESFNVQDGSPCDESRQVCLTLLPSAMETTDEIAQWGPLIQTFFRNHPDVCGPKTSEKPNSLCVVNILSDLQELNEAWVAGQATESANPSCLDNSDLTLFLKFKSQWKGQIPSALVDTLQAAPDTPSFLSNPKFASKVLFYYQTSQALRKALLKAPSQCLVATTTALNNIALRHNPAIPQRITPAIPMSLSLGGCNSTFNLASGSYDTCFAKPLGPIVGMRLTYSVLGAPGEKKCTGIGDLNLLLEEPSGSKVTTMVLSSGVTDIKLPGLCDTAGRFRLAEKPQPSNYVDEERLREAIRYLIPAPIETHDVTVSIIDSQNTNDLPTITFTFTPSIETSTRTLIAGSSVSIVISPNGTQLNGPSQFSIVDAALTGLEKSSLDLPMDLAAGPIKAFSFKNIPDCFDQNGTPVGYDGEATITAAGCIAAPIPGIWPDDRMPVVAIFTSSRAGSKVDLLPVLSVLSKATLQEKIGSEISKLISTPGYKVAVTIPTPSSHRLLISVALIDTPSSGGTPLVISSELSLSLNPQDAVHEIFDGVTRIAALAVNDTLQEKARMFISNITQEINGSFGGYAHILDVKLPPKAPAVSLDVELDVPGLKALVFQIKESDFGLAGIKDAVRSVVFSHLNSYLTTETLGISFGDFAIETPTIDEGKSVGGQLWVDGVLRYGSYVAKVSQRIAPSIGAPIVDVPSKSDLATNALNGLSSMLSIGKNGITNVEIRTINGVPVLYVTLSANVKIFGAVSISGEVQVYAKPGDKHLRFANKLALHCEGELCWFPAGEGLDLGNPGGLIDLEHPENLELDASLAITPGADTSSLMQFLGTIGLQDGSVVLTGTLSVAGFDAAKSTGTWRLRDNLLTFDSGPSGASSFSPLPTIDITLDPPHCLFSGGLTANIFGLSKVNVGAGILFAGAGCANHSLAAPGEEYAQQALLNCQSAGGTLMTACGTGDADVFGTLKAHLHFVAPLLPPKFPILDGTFDLRIAKVSAELTPVFAKLSADLKLIKVTVIVPSIDSMTRGQFEAILKKALEPTLDWDSLKRRDIVISTFPPGQGDTDPNDTTGEPLLENAPTVLPSDVKPVENLSPPTLPGLPPSRPAFSSNVSPSSKIAGKIVPGIWSNVPGYSVDCSTAPYASVYDEGRHEVWRMRMVDACSLINPAVPLHVMSIGYDEIDGEGNYLIACSGNPCSLKAVRALGLERPNESGAMSIPPDLGPLDLTSLSPDVFDGPFAQTFQSMNNLIDYVFSLDDDDRKTLRIECLRTAVASDVQCALAMVSKLKSTGPTLSFYQSYGTVYTVETGSFLDTVYKFLCAGGECSPQSKAALSSTFDRSIAGFWKADDAIYALVSGADPPKGQIMNGTYLPVIIYHQDGSLSSGPFIQISDDPGYYLATERSPANTSASISDLLRIILVHSPDKSWMVKASFDRGRAVYAGASLDPGKNMFTLIERDDGSSWSCLKTYDAIKMGMINWKTGDPAEIRLTPKSFEFLTSQHDSNNQPDRRALLEAIIGRKFEQNGFLENPVLLFGNPGEGSSCP